MQETIVSVLDHCSLIFFTPIETERNFRIFNGLGIEEASTSKYKAVTYSCQKEVLETNVYVTITVQYDRTSNVFGDVHVSAQNRNLSFPLIFR